MLRYFLILFLSFIGISILIPISKVQQFEDRLVQLTENIRTESFNHIMILITNFGSYKVIFPITILFSLIYIFQKKWIVSLFLYINYFGVRNINHVLKELYVRERPDFNPLIEIGEYSFPSGHAMNSLAIYGFIAYLIIQEKRFQNVKYLVYFWIGLLILLIGLSRLYVGVHYPLDIIGGFIFGGLWLLLMTSLLSFIRQK